MFQFYLSFFLTYFNSLKVSETIRNVKDNNIIMSEPIIRLTREEAFREFGVYSNITVPVSYITVPISNELPPVVLPVVTLGEPQAKRQRIN